MVRSDLLTLADSGAWRDALAAGPPADVYYEPAYLAPLAARGEGEPLLFSWQDGRATGLHVILRRPLAALPFDHPHVAHIDAVTPYGYAGPLVSDPAAAPDFWAAWRTAAAAANLVAEFIRFHPLRQNHVAFAPLFDVRRAGVTIWMDLTQPLEATVSKSRRRDARWSARQGVVVETASPDRLPAFTALYHQTMRDRAAEAYYFFDEPYFRALAAALGSDLWLRRAHLAGRDCAYALCLRHGRTLHYHLGCSDPALADTRATTLLLFETAREAAAVGIERFHLGGGFRGADSLFEFKSHFSPERAEFHVGRVVHDDALVADLAARAAAAGGAPADPGFFPPYRSGR